MHPSLAELQALLWRLVTAPNGVEEGLAAEKNFSPAVLSALIRENGGLSAIERVGIYANMYFYRLLDAIKEDFPATLTILGSVDFHNLITGYLVEYPPSRPSITEASLHLAEFAGKSALLDRFPFVQDLIRLERTLVDSFLGSDATPLSFDELRAIPVQDWPSLRIRTHPATHLLDCRWRVDEVLHAVERYQSVPSVRCEQRAILVWRKNCDVYYRALDEKERSALKVICRGAEFEVVCEAITAASGEDTTPSSLSLMLSRWLADGILTSG